MALVKTDDALPQSNPQTNIIRLMAVYTSWHQLFELVSCSLKCVATGTEPPLAVQRHARKTRRRFRSARTGHPSVQRPPGERPARDLIITAEYALLQTLGLGAELATWLDGEKAN